MKAIVETFKPSGKWYTTREYEVNADMSMHAIWAMVRLDLEKRFKAGDYWYYGMVTVPGHPHDHPHLIVPEPMLSVLSEENIKALRG